MLFASESLKLRSSFVYCRARWRIRLTPRLLCINSDRSVTLSGCQSHLEALINILTEQKIFHRSLRTGNAYHSHYMNAASLVYKKLMGYLEPPSSNKKASTLMYSTVTGLAADVTHLGYADYWIENLLPLVQFSKALNCLIQSSTTDGNLLGHFLEVTPSSTLKRFIEDTILATGMDIKYIRTLKPMKTRNN